MAKNKTKEPELYWMGRPLSEYKKKELRGIIKILAEDNARMLSPDAITARAWSRVAALKAV